MTEIITNNLRKFRIYRKRQLRFDLTASLVVFLVAIPLCLGIALASGAPLFSGIISGIIGGLVVGAMSGSPVSVSGPAAGMAAVVLAAITQLGDFNTFLLALVLSGLLQIIVGTCRAGFVADYIPSNVVQGLLCAIGILLIVKQLPFAFSHSTKLVELKAHLLDSTASFNFWSLYNLSEHLNTGAMIISSVGLFILVFWEKIKITWLQNIPAPIFVVLTGIFLNEFFISASPNLTQNNLNLVNIPTTSGISDFIDELSFPKWAAWTNPKVYLYAFILATVASLESLLNVTASEKLDPRKRYCSKNRELVAQGAGNFFAGLVGGIPVTSVIVRTSVNIQAGAKSKLSTILHGFLLLFSIMIIPNLLNKIPLASLAVILIFTGYKLTKPVIYVNIYKQGIDRFIPFIVTVISIVLFNLLVGIMIGLIISLFYILKSNSQRRLDVVQEIYTTGVITRLILPQQITFLNKASLVTELKTFPEDSQVIIDARNSNYIDKEIVEVIKEFQMEHAPLKNISLNLIGFQDVYDINNYINFLNVTTFDAQSHITPSEVLNLLREGNQRFIQDKRIHRTTKLDIKFTSKEQHPIAVVLGCIDSRVPVETIFDMSLGDLFCIRVAGNVINDDVLGSMEYACDVVGAKLIVVLGHSRCGAIHAACDGVEKGHITQLLAKIKPAISAEAIITEKRNSNNPKFVKKVTNLNIANAVLAIYNNSKILQTMIDEDTISVVGAIYDVNSGKATFHDYHREIIHMDEKSGTKLAAKITHTINHANNIKSMENKSKKEL